jgi:hypothetical protein
MSTLKLADGKELNLPDKDEAAKVKYLADTWLNHGRTPDGEKLSWSSIAETISPKHKDLTTTGEVRALLARATETIIREPIEPLMAIEGLFTRVQAPSMRTDILLGALGAVTAGEVDELGTYPEVMFDIGGGIQVATIGKSGIQASFSDEALRYTTWDIMAINLRLMGAAMARHTEYKAVSYLRSMGTVAFDNASPTDSLFGVTTGRALGGSANGTLTIDDLMVAYTHMVETGYTPDTLVMSPQMYFMWVRDPVLRYIFMETGSNVYFATYRGHPGPQATWSNGALGGRGPTMGQGIVPGGAVSGETATPITGYSNRANSSPEVPSYFPFPLQIIVSPMIPYDPVNKLGELYLVASGWVGFHLIDEDPTTVEWRDENIEAVKVKIRARDSFAVATDGLAINVIKNVKNAQNFYNGQVHLQQTVSGTITEIDADTPVV